jgi:hypothetical protein
MPAWPDVDEQHHTPVAGYFMITEQLSIEEEETWEEFTRLTEPSVPIVQYCLQLQFSPDFSFLLFRN